MVVVVDVKSDRARRSARDYSGEGVVSVEALGGSLVASKKQMSW